VSPLSRWLRRDVLIPLGGRRRLSLTTAIIGVGVTGSFALQPGWESPVPTCFGYWLTGIPCPLCGMTRAMIHLAHGRLLDAIGFHPAVILVFPVLVAGLIQSLVRDFVGWNMPAAWRRGTNVVGWSTLLFIIVFGAIRSLWVMASGGEPW